MSSLVTLSLTVPRSNRLDRGAIHDNDRSVGLLADWSQMPTSSTNTPQLVQDPFAELNWVLSFKTCVVAAVVLVSIISAPIGALAQERTFVGSSRLSLGTEKSLSASVRSGDLRIWLH